MVLAQGMAPWPYASALTTAMSFTPRSSSDLKVWVLRLSAARSISTHAQRVWGAAVFAVLAIFAFPSYSTSCARASG